jgi:hypothetical protein
MPLPDLPALEHDVARRWVRYSLARRLAAQRADGPC